MLASFAHVPGGAARTTAEVLLLGGFAVKAGLVPFQVWLPRWYAAAPGPARAIMAGVCVNVAFYGMWRTFALLGRPPGWLPTREENPLGGWAATGKRASTLRPVRRSCCNPDLRRRPSRA